MSRFRTQWDLTVTAGSEADHAQAVAKLRADAELRQQQFGETWEITETPQALTVSARVVQLVDTLDAAG